MFIGDSEIVIDAFTGGVLGRATITKRRHVISLVDSPNHIAFLRSFYNEVRNHSRVVQRWCASMSSMGPSPADMIPNLEKLLSSVTQPKDPFAMDSDNEEDVLVDIDMQENLVNNEEASIIQEGLCVSNELQLVELVVTKNQGLDISEGDPLSTREEPLDKDRELPDFNKGMIIEM